MKYEEFDNTPQPARVLIGSGDDAFARGFQAFINEKMDGMVSCNEIARSSDQLNSIAAREEPDIAVIDTSLRFIIKEVRRLLSQQPGMRCMIIYDNMFPVSLTGGLKSGASGWIAKQSSPREYKERLQELFSQKGKKVPHSQEVTVELLSVHSPINALSEQEFDIFLAVGYGEI